MCAIKVYTEFIQVVACIKWYQVVLQRRHVLFVSYTNHTRSAMFTPGFDPHNVDLDTASPRDVACYEQLSENGYTGGLGGRISALLVILVSESNAGLRSAAVDEDWTE